LGRRGWVRPPRRPGEVRRAASAGVRPPHLRHPLPLLPTSPTTHRRPDRRLLSPLSSANLRTRSHATRKDTPMTNLTETPDVSRIEAFVTQGMHRIGDHEG